MEIRASQPVDDVRPGVFKIYFSFFGFHFWFEIFWILVASYLVSRQSLSLDRGLVSLGMDHCHFMGTTLLTTTRLLTSSTHLLSRICEWHVKLKRLLLTTAFMARPLCRPNPGVNAWAVLLNHFMAETIVKSPAKSGITSSGSNFKFRQALSVTQFH